MQRQKIVITGGAGLVGQNLLVGLVVIDKRPSNLAVLEKLFPLVTAVEADLAEPGEWSKHFADASAVVQLHAQIGAPTMGPFERNNVVATRHVLDRKRVYLVCDGVDEAEGLDFGFTAVFRSFDAALAQALEAKGSTATIAVNFPRGICWRQMPWREG